MARSHCCFPSATKHASPFVDKQSGEVFSRGPTTTHRWSMRPPRMQRRRRASPSSPVETLAIPPRRIRGSEGSPDGRGSWDDRSLPLQSLGPRSLKILDGCDCSRRKNRNSKCSNRETSAHSDVMASAAAAPRQQQFCRAGRWCRGSAAGGDSVPYKLKPGIAGNAGFRSWAARRHANVEQYLKPDVKIYKYTKICIFLINYIY